MADEAPNPNDVERVRGKWVQLAQEAPDEATRDLALKRLARMAVDYPVSAGAPPMVSPSEREAAAVDDKPQEMERPNLAQRALLAARGGTARARQFERGVSDTVTLGLAERAAKKFLPMVGYDMSDYNDKQAAQDAQEAPMARAVGGLAGALVPGGAAARIGGGAVKAMGALRGAVGLAPGVLAGAAEGAAATPIAAGVLAGAQQASNATAADDLQSMATGLAHVPRAALDAGEGALTSPLAMGLGAAGGAVGGAGARIRGSNTQTGRDIRTVEAGGGKPSLASGARGGVFDEAPLAGRNPTDVDTGGLARDAGDMLRARLADRYKGAQETYGADKAAADLTGRVDVTDKLNAMLGDTEKLQMPTATRNAVLSRVQSEFLDDPRVQKMWQGGRFMPSAEELNYLRQRLDGMAETGQPGEDTAIRAIAEHLRSAEDTTPMADVKGPYAEEAQALKRAHNQLGLGPRLSTSPDDQVAGARVANAIVRRGQTTTTAGVRGKPLEEFAAENPDLAPLLNSVDLMNAAGRLKGSLGAGEHGGLHHRALSLGVRNIEPLLGGLVYPYATQVPGRLIPPAALLASPEFQLQEALDAQRRR